MTATRIDPTAGFLAIEIEHTLARGMGLPVRRLVVRAGAAKRIVDKTGRIDIEALAEEANESLRSQAGREAVRSQGPAVARVALHASRAADREGRFEASLRLATIAVQWSPQDLECRAARAIAQARVGHYDEALAGFVDVLEADKEYVASGLRVLAVRTALLAERPILAESLAAPLRRQWVGPPAALTKLLDRLDSMMAATT